MYLSNCNILSKVSSGALDMAKANLEKMLIVCVKPLEDADQLTREKQKKALCKVTHELVRQVTSPHTLVREQVWQLQNAIN